MKILVEEPLNDLSEKEHALEEQKMKILVEEPLNDSQ